jgi:hemerythrin superfamily protein
MASDAVTLIKNDHRLMEQLFARLEAGEGDRQELVREIEARLLAHARAEEAEVYPVLAGKAGEQEEAEHGTHEHHEAEHKFRKVRNLIGSPHFDEALREFVAAIDHHVREEESEMLPALVKAADKKTLDRLGTAFERVRLGELGANGYDRATRDELYEKAKQADIPGRSRMTKEELREALRDET